MIMPASTSTMIATCVQIQMGGTSTMQVTTRAASAAPQGVR